MADHDFDLFVIGAGSGGVRAARLAALSGAKVAVAEESRVGGTCVVRGCVPKKFMVYASEFSSQVKTAEGYGWTVPTPRFDWKTFLTAKDVEIARLSGIYVTNLRKAGAHLLHGKARVIGPNTVEVEPKEGSEDAGRYTAKRILIATGGRPTKPDFPGAELGITSNEAFHLPELPKRILVVGGGSRNRLMCQATADAAGIPVVSFSLEGTAVGNIARQLISLGAVKNLATFRRLLGANLAQQVYEPRG